MPQASFYPLQGGLNLVTPSIRTPPGHLIAGSNYEPVERGYRRIQGYERFDGRPKPSEASYWLLNYDAGTAAIAEGDTVTGATSGATGKALIAQVVSTGSYAGSDAAGYLVLTAVVGTFQNNENLQVSAVTRCAADGAAAERGASNDTDDTTWIRDAIETARALIGTVTGAGRIRGIWVSPSGTVYAFRDNAASTAGGMWESTAAGWSAVSLGYRASFTTGTAEISEGDTVTGASSAATGVVARVALRTGSYADSTAAGQIIFASTMGTFSDGENLHVGGVTKAVASGASAALALPAAGRYEFTNHNFYGASNKNRMYGCNGVGTAFEFDGTVFAPIVTGMTTDTPAHIAEFKNHLFLSFAGGSIQNSSTGNPYGWSAVTGAAEISVGHDVTGFCTGYAKSLLVLARNKICELFGNDTADFVMETLAEDAGGIEWTVQQIGVPIYMDDRGLRDIRTTAAYGDFKMGTLTQMIEPLFRQKKAAGVTPTASMRCRAKDQYRLFFSDGTGVTVYMGRKVPEAIPFNLGITVYAACSSEDANGNEIMFVGSDDGYVYQLDAGTSLDGDSVEAYMRLPFNHIGSPTQNKRFHKATLEVDADPTASLGMLAEFSYGATDQSPSQQQNFTVQGGGGFWGVDSWGDFYWGSPVEGIAECYIEGVGTNISIAVVSNATYEDPHTIHGITLHWTPRGQKR